MSVCELLTISGPKRDEAGDGCILTNFIVSVFHKIAFTTMIKSGKMRWAGHVAHWKT
jgi:hypothetical protein